MFKFAVAATTGLPAFVLVANPSPPPAVVVGASVASPTPVRLDPVVHLGEATPSQRSVLAEAFARFRDAGLALPELQVRFSEQDDDCLGHDGLFDQGRSPWRITICSGAEFVPTHELAHAWEAAHLDDADREHYTHARGFETWNGRHVAWAERAIEDAAFVIQQNLMAGDHVDAGSERWRERTAAFELLTGQRSPVLDRGRGE